MGGEDEVGGGTSISPCLKKNSDEVQRAELESEVHLESFIIQRI